MSDQEIPIFNNAAEALDTYFTARIVDALESGESLPATFIDQMIKARKADLLVPHFHHVTPARGEGEGGVVGQIGGANENNGPPSPIPQGELTCTSKWMSKRFSNGTASA